MPRKTKYPFNVAELARSTGFARSHVNSMLDSGHTEADIRAKATFPKKAKRNSTPKGNDAETFNAAKAKKEHYLALKHQLDYEQQLGKLVEIEEVNQWVMGMIAKAKSVWQRMSKELPDRLAKTSDVSEVKRLIDDEVNRGLNELATYKGEAR